MKSVLSDVERDLVLGTMHVLKEHLVREARDAQTGTTRGRLVSKDLLSEAERVLLRTASGLSLLDRLRRDETLRDEMLSLLKEFADNADDY